MQGLSDRLRLASRRDVELRVRDLLHFYSKEYGSAIFVGERTYTPRSLVLTQGFIESDKLGLVLRSVLFGMYQVPIIVVTGLGGLHYVVDGHHRVIVYAWLGWRIPGLTILVPKYRPKLAKSIIELDSVNPVDTPQELICWRHIVNTVRFLEKQYNTLARIWVETISITLLKPTQPPIPGPEPHALSLHCPPLVYKYNQEYFVIDGHHRICREVLSSGKEVKALVFTIDNLEIGLLKTARMLGYDEFNEKYCSGG
ncbi:chromosome partitioning protein ParB [Desulfurococcus amylolyticus]|uniref:chromosome partitioning protein ParB n=1 Tax=Desulfurococcus amylolyticus TaxID=94694 RepID=UPI0005B1FB25|nr:chromosome partitioning protein ParB [Desulfurococcus amylolyticus]